MQLNREELQKAWKDFKKLGRKTQEFRQLTTPPQQTPPGYAEWEDVAERIAAHCAMFKMFPEKMHYRVHENFSQTLASCLSMYLAHTNSPTLYLAPELFSAFCNSHVPTKTGHLKRPLKLGVLMLPQGQLFTPDGEQVDFIVFGHWLKGDSKPSIRLDNQMKIPSIMVEFDQLQVFTFTREQTIYSSSLEISVDQDSELSLADRSGRGWIHCPSLSKEKLHPAEIEQQFLRSLDSLVLQSILLMQAKPELIDPPQQQKKGVANTKKMRPLPPRWIGKSYRFERQTEAETTAPGTHGSPTAHIRRGHWHSYPIGSRQIPLAERERRWHWIEPIAVNFKSEAQ